MAYTVADLKQDLTGVIHGTTLNKITGLDPLINRSARKLLEDVDPMETKRTVAINNALYDQVYDYQCPVDLKGDRIIDIKPMANRQRWDRFFQQYNETFDLDISNNANNGVILSAAALAGNFSINYNTGVKSLRIGKSLIPSILLNACESLTDNGTWTASPLATNIRTDEVTYVQGSAAIKFDLSAGADPSLAVIENSTMTAIDLSNLEDQGALFVAVYIPDGNIADNFILRWGTSVADYWERTVTTTQSATVFQSGWNILRFDWDGATEVGAPDSSAVNYLQLTLQYDGTATTGIVVDNFTAGIGTGYHIEYYSKFMFRDAITGAFQETVTDDTNIINLDTDSYNMLFNLVAYYAAQQQQGSNAQFDFQFFLREYLEAVKRYVAKIRSETIKPQETYYRMPRRRGVSTRLPY